MMKKNLILLLGLSLPFVGTMSAQVIIPVTSGQASGGQFFQFNQAFDAQPGSIPTDGQLVPGDNIGNGIQNFGGARQGYIDFGVNFATITITETWTAFRAFGAVTGPNPFSALWWSSDTTNTFSGGDVVATGFNFGTRSIAYDGANAQWTRDFTGLSITPLARYLIVEDGSATFAGGRGTELLIVGFTSPVPEPSTLTLGLVGLAMGVIGYRQRSCALRKI
jgi:hypothetical protein